MEAEGGDGAWDANSIVLSGMDPEWSALSVERTCFLLQTDPRRGLSLAEVEDRKAAYGPNVLHGEKSPTFLGLVMRHVVDFLMILLLVASGVSFGLGEYVDGAVILAIAVLNVFVGALQEFRAEKTLEALRKLSASNAVVLRNGAQVEVAASGLVPGDVVILALSGSASAIPADARLVEAVELCTSETVLTGESVPVKKRCAVEANASGDRFHRNMVYSGTAVSSGRGVAVVVRTGMATELGKIAAAVGKKKHTHTDLQRELRLVSVVLFAIGLVFAFVVFASTGFDASTIRYTAVYAVAMIVAIIPEELPLVLTLTMVLGVRRMTQVNVIVRQMSALEQLGRVTNICSDKTGTITQGMMSVTRVWLADSDSFGEVGGRLDSSSVQLIGLVAGKCNSSNGRTGQHTDVALYAFATTLGYKDKLLLLQEFPFDSSLKRMTSVVCDDQGRRSVLMKGSAETVLPLCTRFLGSRALDPGLVIQRSRAMAEQGLRVIVFAVRGAIVGDAFFCEDGTVRELIEQDMVCLGAVGLQDPPRDGVLEAVQDCIRGGITVHMLTGDDLHTATSIAKAVEIASGDGDAVHAREFDALTDGQLDTLENVPRVIARCTPESKVKMVRALRRRNMICSMTGDGVNDAPALSAANVGVAMGISGSDVTRQAAHLVLSDDNFVSIVAAIREGRRIFHSIQKFVVHVLATNVGMVLVLMIGLALRGPEGTVLYPQSALEILVLNMFVLSVPLIGLVMEPPDFDVMAERPRKSRYVLSLALVTDILIYGVFLGVCGIAVFSSIIYGVDAAAIRVGTNCSAGSQNGTSTSSNVTAAASSCNCNSPSNYSQCQSTFAARGATFLAMALIIVFSAFNCRHAYRPFWRNLSAVTRPMIIGTLIVLIAVFVLIYVPGLNVYAMHHDMLTWQLGIAFAALAAYIVLACLWKLGFKGRVFPEAAGSQI